MSQLSSQVFSISETSRYKDTPLYAVTDIVSEWGLWVSDPTFLTDSDYAMHQIRSGDIGRLDLVAWKHYSNTSYWWMIAHANSIVDPLTELQVGQFIRVPSLSAIERFVQRRVPLT